MILLQYIFTVTSLVIVFSVSTDSNDHLCVPVWVRHRWMMLEPDIWLECWAGPTA